MQRFDQPTTFLGALSAMVLSTKNANQSFEFSDLFSSQRRNFMIDPKVVGFFLCSIEDILPTRLIPLGPGFSSS